ALERHYAIGLRPATVVADGHADLAAKRVPDIETEIADLEIFLLQMLDRKLCTVVGMARQVDHGGFADAPARLVDQDGAVEIMLFPFRQVEFRIAEIETDTDFARQIEQRPGFRSRHFPLEETVDLVLILHPPTWKEGG